MSFEINITFGEWEIQLFGIGINKHGLCLTVLDIYNKDFEWPKAEYYGVFNRTLFYVSVGNSWRSVDMPFVTGTFWKLNFGFGFKQKDDPFPF